MVSICRLLWGPQRAINCYIILSVWILIIIAGIYKFLEPIQPFPEAIIISDQFQKLETDTKTRKIFQICNEPQDITPGDEGILNQKSWTLKGILILFRHGDRGPLQHIRNVSAVDCSTPETDTLAAYRAYLHNASLMGKATAWTGPGSFHGFPLLPANPRKCALGQLTMRGVAQLLSLGTQLKQRYSDVWPRARNFSATDVAVYSTRYHRTFQSALALLFGLVPPDALSRLSFIESPSMTFCFKDCGCPVTDKYFKAVAKSTAESLRTHPAIKSLAQVTGNLIFSTDAEHGQFAQDPQSVRDALLTYICHDSHLPCDSPIHCIRRQNILGIFMYHDWMTAAQWKTREHRRLSLLLAYGLVKHLVAQMLRILSAEGNGGVPHLVAYAGHDHTLLQLAAALGLRHDAALARYAGRLIFEIYAASAATTAAETDTAAYFRLLANGRDVTRQIAFCKSTRTLRERVHVCRIEDIVRFLHDDYFAAFNATNFKDACSAKNI